MMKSKLTSLKGVFSQDGNGTVDHEAVRMAVWGAVEQFNLASFQGWLWPQQKRSAPGHWPHLSTSG